MPGLRACAYEYGTEAMNQLPPARRAEVLRALCLGASLRGVARSTGISINTATKLLIDAGEICAQLHDQRTRGITVRRLLCNKALARIVTTGVKVGRTHGWTKGIWTWAGFDAESGLIVSHHVGDGDLAAAEAFWADLQSRIDTPPAADFGAQLFAREGSLGLVFSSAGPSDGGWTLAPAEMADLAVIAKMAEGRFTRMRNAYARSEQNFTHMVAINTIWHNYIRSPPGEPTRAMRAGLADRPWSFQDVLAYGLQPAA